MILRWSSVAARDLDGHFDYIARDNPDAAIRVDEAIRQAVERLVDQPYRGKPGRREGTRELVVPQYPSYIVVYGVVGEEIRIFRVLHGRQNWPA